MAPKERIRRHSAADALRSASITRVTATFEALRDETGRMLVQIGDIIADPDEPLADATAVAVLGAVEAIARQHLARHRATLPASGFVTLHATGTLRVRRLAGETARHPRARTHAARRAR
jgi:hypothetical protein